MIGGIDLGIKSDLRALHGLPANYDNFRCAMKTRDELPTTEILQIKILKDTNARQDKVEEK